MRAASLLLLWFAACYSGPAGPADTPDLAAPIVPAPAGLFEDCVPGDPEAGCREGLRCAIVLVGDPPHEGVKTQCVPLPGDALADDAECTITEETEAPEGADRKRFDRCAKGSSCVATAASGLRCRRLCRLRVRGQCARGELCVLASQVSSLGYCARPDGCVPVWPQRGCPRAPDGTALSCHVFTEARTQGVPGDPEGGTYCLRHAPLGGSSGALNERCERSANCREGLACVLLEGASEPVCRPYCALPPADGGVPDGGVVCAMDLGMCKPIAYHEQVGRCL